MEQYNTGAHQSLGNLSPFEIFFGRKPNPYCQGITIEDQEDIHCINEEKNKTIDEHNRKCQSYREKAKQYSDAAAKKMVLRKKRKFPPSEYEVGEEVIVKNIYSGKKIKNTKIYGGIIKERKGDRYKVEYEKRGKIETSWFPVSQVTSRTKAIENEKQAMKRLKPHKGFKKNYHLDKANVVNEECIKAKSETTKASKAPKEKYNLIGEIKKKELPYKLRIKRVSN